MGMAAGQTHAPSAMGRAMKSESLLRAPWGSWGLGPVFDLAVDGDRVRRWKSGTILVSEGSVDQLWGRWWGYQANVWQVWWLQRWPKLPKDTCRIDYTFPGNGNEFLTLRFVQTGRHTTLKTVHAALRTLEKVAKLRDAYAIVCCLSNQRLHEKIMARWGYERHARKLPGLHFIKRFRDYI